MSKEGHNDHGNKGQTKVAIGLGMLTMNLKQKTQQTQCKHTSNSPQ